MEGVQEASSTDKKTEHVDTAAQQESQDQNGSQPTEKDSNCQRAPTIPTDVTSGEGTAGTSKKKVSKRSRFSVVFYSY